MYKIELHLHTKYSSGCGQMDEKEIISAYKAAGYHGIVVTDHFSRDTFHMKGIDPAAPVDRLTPYLEGFTKMKEEGEKQGIVIYRGAELRFDGSYNDYLFYNYPDQLLQDPEQLFTMGLEKFIERSRPTGALLIQAHPFRPMCTPAQISSLDGIEIVNLHPGHQSRNHLAKALAETDSRLIRTGGSDCHATDHIGRGGILSETLPKNDAELAALLRSGNYTIIEE